MIRRRVVIHGLVQGVFFRDTCRREAARLGVSGWVHNRYDDTVEAVYEGPAEAVDAMVSWSRKGPSRAHVTRIDVWDEDPEGVSGFEVR